VAARRSASQRDTTDDVTANDYACPLVASPGHSLKGAAATLLANPRPT
jgi:hypothetical protein